jgi:hypothetical protein
MLNRCRWRTATVVFFIMLVFWDARPGRCCCRKLIPLKLNFSAFFLRDSGRRADSASPATCIGTSQPRRVDAI